MSDVVLHYSPLVIFLTLSASAMAVAMSVFSKVLGLRWGSQPTEAKKAVRALPASWYTSQEILPNSGDWLRYEVAGFQFILAKDRDGNINAFHNICRHRAFPVVTEETGHNSIFACKYHNWSYSLNGKLAKAPGYQELEGFDKSKNGLLPIHLHIDTNGFIWVNLDGGEKPAIAWNDEFEGVDTQERFKFYNFSDYQFDHTWEMEGEYNWKILADNYNECYHCPTSHPDIPALADLNSYKVQTKGSHIQHFGNPKPEQIEKGFNIAATFYFPNASLNVSPHFFFIQRFVPLSPGRSIMKYEVFRNKNSSDEDFQVISDMYKRIMSEDKYLCANAQKNVNAGVFVNGEMHPRMEQGPLYFQGKVRDVVQDHHQQEKAAGREIWPARQTLPSNAVVSEKDLGLCSTVECSSMNGRLEW